MYLTQPEMRTLSPRKCNILSAVSFLLVNGWFDHNRWFLRALSCEWGCTLPSYNDRGSQAPSFCPSGAKSWPVWWVPVDYFTLFILASVGLHPASTTFVSLSLPPFAHLTSSSRQNLHLLDFSLFYFLHVSVLLPGSSFFNPLLPASCFFKLNHFFWCCCENGLHLLIFKAL